MSSSHSVGAFATGLLLLTALSWPAAWAEPVTSAELEKAAGDNSSWLMYSRDYSGQRFVRLDQITPANVNRLRPVWVFPTGGENRGLEATPLIHEGVLYVSADESRVFALDARTGAKKWSYDPKMSDDVERVYCCGSINRGVALLGELVYVGTMDARMIALHKDTGKVVWETEVTDWEQGYSITGAPLVVKDMVLTGVAGGEYGIRGFVKAFDAKTGELRWTAYTIPGPGEPGNDSWPGDTWKNGGGIPSLEGAIDWQPLSCNPDLGCIYFMSNQWAMGYKFWAEEIRRPTCHRLAICSRLMRSGGFMPS